MGCKVPFITVLIVVLGGLLMQKASMIIPILCISIGTLYLFGTLVIRNEARNELSKIKDIDTFKVKDIIDICNNVKEEMGKSGYFNMIVAIEGSIKKKFNSSLHALCVEDDTGEILIKSDDKKDYMIDLISPKTIESVYPIYIVGEASDISGELMIQQPKDFNIPFVTVLTSKQKYINQKKQVGNSISDYIVSSLFILAGIIWLIVGILK